MQLKRVQKKQVDGERSHIQYVASELKHQRKKLEIWLFKGGKRKESELSEDLALKGKVNSRNLEEFLLRIVTVT